MSEWINRLFEWPEDDQNVLVINEKIISMLPVKAYYCEEWHEFMSLESDCNVPLSVTHWMPIPKHLRYEEEDER